jgi:C4-dicarboxylate-specific signal transduction histidine kinase
LELELWNIGTLEPLEPFNPDLPWLERANRLALIARQLSSTIHDVNNILQVISGHAELLHKAPGASDVVIRRGQTIGAQAERATIALAELAAFAKDAADHSETVGLRDLAQRAMTMRSHSLSKLRVPVVVDGEEVKVRGSSRRLLQIVLNLIVNAEQALAGAQAPQLRVAVARVGECAELSVEDNGQTSADGRDPYRLGIGLSVSEWLAAEQGGSLTRVTLPTGGSRSTLSIPIQKDQTRG